SPELRKPRGREGFLADCFTWPQYAATHHERSVVASIVATTSRSRKRPHHNSPRVTTHAHRHAGHVSSRSHTNPRHIMFGDIGIETVLLTLWVILLLFGAKRLPEFGRSLGKGIREFKGSLSGVKDAISEPAQPEATPFARSDAEPVREPRRLMSDS